MGEVINLPLTEKDCFVVKGSVGYYTGNIYKPFDSIENANLFLMDLESAKMLRILIVAIASVRLSQSGRP